MTPVSESSAVDRSFQWPLALLAGALHGAILGIVFAVIGANDLFLIAGLVIVGLLAGSLALPVATRWILRRTSLSTVLLTTTMSASSGAALGMVFLGANGLIAVGCMGYVLAISWLRARERRSTNTVAAHSRTRSAAVVAILALVLTQCILVSSQKDHLLARDTLRSALDVWLLPEGTTNVACETQTLGDYHASCTATLDTPGVDRVLAQRQYRTCPGKVERLALPQERGSSPVRCYRADLRSPADSGLHYVELRVDARNRQIRVNHLVQ